MVIIIITTKNITMTTKTMPVIKKRRIIHFILVGDCNTGKSSLIRRYHENIFDTVKDKPTIGVDFVVHKINFSNHGDVEITIYDTAGQERFATMTSTFYRNAHCVMIVYALDDKKSFDNLGKWLDQVKRQCSKANVKIMILGNKMDLDSRKWKLKLPVCEAVLKDELHYDFNVVSAKSGNGVRTAFIQLIRRVLEDETLESYRNIKKIVNNNNTTTTTTTTSSIITANIKQDKDECTC